jgi:hypothetical protein
MCWGVWALDQSCPYPFLMLSWAVFYIQFSLDRPNPKSIANKKINSPLMLEIDGNNCIASDLKISNTKNVAANLEIDSQKLSLPIQKSIVELCPC